MAALEQEQPRVVLLDAKHPVLPIRNVYQGSVNQQPRDGSWYRWRPVLVPARRRYRPRHP